MVMVNNFRRTMITDCSLAIAIVRDSFSSCHAELEDVEATLSFFDSRLGCNYFVDLSSWKYFVSVTIQRSHHEMILPKIIGRHCFHRKCYCSLILQV